jgi:hypothetical protein
MSKQSLILENLQTHRESFKDLKIILNLYKTKLRFHKVLLNIMIHAITKKEFKIFSKLLINQY